MLLLHSFSCPQSLPAAESFLLPRATSWSETCAAPSGTAWARGTPCGSSPSCSSTRANWLCPGKSGKDQPTPRPQPSKWHPGFQLPLEDRVLPGESPQQQALLPAAAASLASAAQPAVPSQPPESSEWLLQALFCLRSSARGGCSRPVWLSQCLWQGPWAWRHHGPETVPFFLCLQIEEGLILLLEVLQNPFLHGVMEACYLL